LRPTSPWSATSILDNGRIVELRLIGNPDRVAALDIEF